VNLYKLFQTVNNNWDTYDSVIVAAESKEDAVKIHPDGYTSIVSWLQDWADPADIKCELIGQAAPHIKPGVVLASFRAG
jgi:hypothetical protein